MVCPPDCSVSVRNVVQVAAERVPHADGDGLLPLLLLHHQPQLPRRGEARGHNERKQQGEILSLQSGMNILPGFFNLVDESG